MPRPNAAPRPVCRYFNTPRGCFAADKCHYVHGDPAVQKYAPYEEHKTCQFYARGYCKRGKDCWFKHVSIATCQIESTSVTDGDAPCGICFDEKPALYGLLSECSHAFCLRCIRQWRDPEGKAAPMQESGIHKTCPMCRQDTKFITPSSRFYPQGDSRKADVIDKYKESMAKVPCRYFIQTGRKLCPFGRDCFYQHINTDGCPFEFTDGVDVMMTQWKRQQREEAHSRDSLGNPLQAAFVVLEGLAPNDPTLASLTRMIRSMQSRMIHLNDLVAEGGPELSPEEEHVSSIYQQQWEEEEPGLSPVEEHVPSIHQQLREDELQETGLSSDSVSFEDSTAAVSQPLTPAIPPLYNAHFLDSHSDDPRAPANTSRHGELTLGDFAWMMEERRDAPPEENCGLFDGLSDED